MKQGKNQKKEWLSVLTPIYKMDREERLRRAYEIIAPIIARAVHREIKEE